ncbi:hypothetical protein [Winogradskyella sp. PC D3.3]
MFGDYYVLWYSTSNSYSIIDSDFKLLLDLYLASNTKNEFSLKISNHFCDMESSQIYESISNYLKDCNNPYSLPSKSLEILDTSYRNISKQYLFNSKHIQIYYSSELVLKTVHPAIAHFCKTTTNEPDVTFDIYLNDDHLYLFKNAELITRVPKREYHHLQGKFIMQLLCSLHNKTEHDWIGTLHGSTITDGHSSILFVGKSGKGKSTLSALLATNGFQLLADDVSQLLSEDQHIYYNPSSISIKQGAFNLLEPLVNNFEDLPIVEFNKIKGQLKYMPCPKPEQNHYPCRAIILVNYTPESKTIIESVSIKQVLETIIEDSWLSPNPKHAQQFLDWLETVKLYQITYSDTTSVSATISTLFKQFNYEN